MGAIWAAIRAVVAKYGSKISLGAIWNFIRGKMIPAITTAYQKSPASAKAAVRILGEAGLVVGISKTAEKYFGVPIPQGAAGVEKIMQLIKNPTDGAGFIVELIDSDPERALQALMNVPANQRADFNEDYQMLVETLSAQVDDAYTSTGDHTRGTVYGRRVTEILSSHAIMERAEDLIVDTAAMFGARSKRELSRLREFFLLDQDLYGAAVDSLVSKRKLG